MKLGIINNESDYATVMAKIDSIMARGSENVSKDELTEIRELALAVQEFEQKKYDLSMPDA